MANTAEAWFQCTLGDDALRFRSMQAREDLGRLPEYRIGRLVRIRLSDLERLRAVARLKHRVATRLQDMASERPDGFFVLDDQHAFVALG